MKNHKYWPECYNSECNWNMGAKNKRWYGYLDNTCYHDKDTSEYKKCDNRIEKQKDKL